MLDLCAGVVSFVGFAKVWKNICHARQLVQIHVVGFLLIICISWPKIKLVWFSGHDRSKEKKK
jgi:hypothetical protein